MKYNKADVTVGGRSFLPKGLYRARISGTETKKSGKGHDMTVLTCEIIEPEVLEVNGVNTTIAGREFRLYCMHVPGESWGQSQVFDFMDKLKIDHGGEYDTDLHKEYFLGMEFDIVLSSEEDVKRYAPAPGEKQGKPILDGEGNPMSNGWNITANLSDVAPNCRPSRTELAF